MNRVNPFAVVRIFVACCALVDTQATAQVCVAPPAGMLGWWTGDGDSTDLQSGLHAVAHNGATYGPGLVGEAFLFDGIASGQDDRVELPPVALDGRMDMTIEMWVQTSDDQAAFISGASNQNASTDNEVTLFQGANGLFAFLRQMNTGQLPVFVNDGAWHHMALARAGAMGVLYVDGVVVDARSFPTNPFEIGPGGLVLGQEQDCLAGCFDVNQAFDGMMDEVAIYDRALSDEEILAIFEAGELGKCKPSSMDDLLVEISGLQLEVESLQTQITELEAAAAVDAETSCDHSHRNHHRHWRKNWRRHKQHHD